MKRSKEKKEKKEKSILLIVALIISILLLIGGSICFIYTLGKKNESTNEINDLNQKIVKVKDKITSDKEEKETKTGEYEKLEENLKESIEELNVWKDLKEELQQSLS